MQSETFSLYNKQFIKNTFVNRSNYKRTECKLHLQQDETNQGYCPFGPLPFFVQRQFLHFFIGMLVLWGLGFLS
jgi:hypothetical protein